MWGFRSAAERTLLTRLSLLVRTGYVYPHRRAAINGERRIQLEVGASGGSRRHCYLVM
jgi:hypothetical protein